MIELTDKRANNTSKSLLLGVGEVEIEVEQGLVRKKASEMFNDSRAEDGLAASRYAIKPHEGSFL